MITSSADGQTHPLECDGPLLGIFPGEEFAQSTVQLSPGDRVFIYSDGVEQAFSGGPGSDNENWRRQIEALNAMPTGEMFEHFARCFDEQASNPVRPNDDLTLIAIEIG